MIKRVSVIDSDETLPIFYLRLYLQALAVVGF